MLMYIYVMSVILVTMNHYLQDHASTYMEPSMTLTRLRLMNFKEN